MTKLKRKALEGTGLLLVLALLLSIMLPAWNAETTGGARGQRSNPQLLNASVTIKTQKAADSIKGGIRGIDVSKYQGTIDWKKVAATGNVNFAFIRASYGLTNDPNFVTNATNAHTYGIKVGAYHFATFKDSASVKKEAAYFVSRLKKVNITYPVVLDLEGASHKKMKKATLTKLAKQFMDLVRAEGYTVMLYSYNNFIKDHIDTSQLKDYDLWVANYLEQPKTIDHVVWQHTSYGTVKGISGRVDINIAYKDLSTNKKTKVDKTVSDSIKRTLNERYDVGLPIDGLNMAKMNKAIATGLQMEINRQWDESLVVDGEMNREAMRFINSLTFTSETKGNITYLIQAKLFYKGMYTGELTARFDSNTVKAVKAYQKSVNLPVDGNLDDDTLNKLLM